MARPLDFIVIGALRGHPGLYLPPGKEAPCLEAPWSRPVPWAHRAAA